MDITAWIEQNTNPELCNSETFFYDEMESQSGFCLPIIYQPFNAADRSHWHDRGSMFDFLLAVDGEGKRLLDFGPGDGWPSLIVAPFAGEVVGVDGSRKRVEVCTQNAARLGITNARFLYVEPGCPLPFPDGWFDGVMAASSIEQTPDPRATLRELFRVLRPGGRLRIHYESLGYYRGAQEREADLSAIDAHSCWLTLYDRDIAGERARMFRLAFNLPVEETARVFGMGGQQPLWQSLTIDRLEALRPHIRAARTCTLSHPSGETYARWLREVGFREVRATHNGAWFAGQLYNELPAQERPADLQGVDVLLRPLVKIAIQMPAPLKAEQGWDPMITAVK